MNQERDLARTHIAPSAPIRDDDLAPGRGSRSSQMNGPSHPMTSGLIQRKARDTNGVADGADAAVASAASSAGSSLPEPIMRKFESSLGADLSSVRIHTGSESQTAAESVGAKAYTMGQDIHFAAGQYAPSSTSGQHLLAHEVAHTQQQAGGAPYRQYKLEATSPGDATELDADRAADAMTAGQPAQVSTKTTVQRTIARDVKNDTKNTSAPESGARSSTGEPTSPETMPQLDADATATTPALSPIRQELLKLFGEFEKKVVGDTEFDDVITKKAWDEQKSKEAAATEIYEQDKKKYEEDMVKFNNKEISVKPKMPIPVAKFTTCIATQVTLLKAAFKRTGLQINKGKQLHYDFATAGKKNAEAISPHAWFEASVGMSARPNPGDMFVLASRGSKVDKAVEALNYIENLKYNKKEGGVAGNIAKKSAANNTAQDQLTMALQAEEAAEIAVGALTEAHTTQTDAALIKAKSALANAVTKLNMAKTKAASASSALDKAENEVSGAQEAVDEARAGVDHKKTFEFSHVGFLMSRVVNDDRTETWTTFDGGQRVPIKGNETQEGSQASRRVYDPNTNEIAGEQQQGGKARWLQGWVNVDELVKT